MFEKIVNFVKYNNLMVLILLGFFLIGSSVFAATDTGQQVIGTKQVSYEGIDNTLLLEADLTKLAMDFKISSIKEDDKFYYVTYTFINLEPVNKAWQYQITEKARKVSKRERLDLGKYLAEQLKQEYDERIRELKDEQTKANTQGKSEVTEVESYSGLIGKTLAIASAVFPGYESIKKTIVPSPSVPMLLTTPRNPGDALTDNNTVDNLSNIYNDYIANNQALINDLNTETSSSTASTTDDVVPIASETPAIITAPIETNNNTSSTSVEVIELPTSNN